MTDIGDERKHKPSAKHTLEEVRKSLEDLVRNEFVDAGPTSTRDPKASDQSDKSSPFAPAPPLRSRQRLQTMQKRNVDTSQVLKSLNELIGSDLSESGRHDADDAQSVAAVDVDTEIDRPASEPDDVASTRRDILSDAESLESLADQLAEPHEVDAETVDPATAVDPTAENAGLEEIPWSESADGSTTDDGYPILDEDADDLDAVIDAIAEMETDTEHEEITLEAATVDPATGEAPASEALSSIAEDSEPDADTPALEVEEVDLDETAAVPDESWEVDAASPPTPPPSDSLPRPELSPADRDRAADTSEEAAITTDEPAPNTADTADFGTADQPEESMEYPDDDAPFVPEAQQTFDFDALEAARSTADTGAKSTKTGISDEIEPKELPETAEIPDKAPRQAEDSELRLEDTKSALVEPAGEMVPLVPDEEMSMELGVELEAVSQASRSADEAGAEDDSPALSPMDALEIPGEEATSEEVTEQDQADMQHSAQDQGPTISPTTNEATTVLLTPDEAPSGDQAPSDTPDVELDQSKVEPDQGESVSESSESAGPSLAKPSSDVSQPSDIKQAPTAVVTLPDGKQEDVARNAPTTSPKNKLFTVASAVEAKELKMPGIDFHLSKAADKTTRGTDPEVKGPRSADKSSPDDSEYIDLAKPVSAKEAAPPLKRSKEGYPRTPWPTPSALFRKDSASKIKQTSGTSWGSKGVRPATKGPSRGMEPPVSTTKVDVPAKAKVDVPAKAKVDVPAKAKVDVPAKAKVDVPAKAKVDIPAKTSDPTGQLQQPKPKARIEKGMENIPVLNEVVDRPTQLRKSKKKPVPLAASKVTSPGISRKKQSKHKVLEPSSATPKAEARNVAVNVIAKLNMELRKCGERALSPVTIDRLQFLLREALEQYGKDVENGPKRR